MMPISIPCFWYWFQNFFSYQHLIIRVIQIRISFKLSLLDSLSFPYHPWRLPPYLNWGHISDFFGTTLTFYLTLYVSVFSSGLWNVKANRQRLQILTHLWQIIIGSHVPSFTFLDIRIWLWKMIYFSILDWIGATNVIAVLYWVLSQHQMDTWDECKGFRKHARFFVTVALWTVPVHIWFAWIGWNPLIILTVIPPAFCSQEQENSIPSGNPESLTFKERQRLFSQGKEVSNKVKASRKLMELENELNTK